MDYIIPGPPLAVSALDDQPHHLRVTVLEQGTLRYPKLRRGYPPAGNSGYQVRVCTRMVWKEIAVRLLGIPGRYRPMSSRDQCQASLDPLIRLNGFSTAVPGLRLSVPELPR
jgi:hypothetical protein